MKRYFVFFIFLLPLLITTAQAGGGHEHGAGGHDHGGEPEAGMPTEPASPRLTMESKQFELTAILEHDGLVLYVDDYATNAPIADASLELEIAGQRINAIAKSDGSYYAAMASPLKPGKHPVLATILAGKASDLLIGDLVIPEPEHPHEDASGEPHNEMLPWWIAGAISLLAIILVTVQRDRYARRETA